MASATGREALAAIPLFESLSSSNLDELAPWFDVQITGEDVRVIGEGSSGYSFFILTQGSAAVTTNDGASADLGPGDFFGEIAILGDGRRTATVTTTSPSQLLVMFGTEFRRLQLRTPTSPGESRKPCGSAFPSAPERKSRGLVGPAQPASAGVLTAVTERGCGPPRVAWIDARWAGPPLEEITGLGPVSGEG